MRKGWNLRPSRVRGWRENAAGPRNLRLDQAKEELPGWPGRATSDQPGCGTSDTKASEDPQLGGGSEPPTCRGSSQRMNEGFAM